MVRPDPIEAIQFLEPPNDRRCPHSQALLSTQLLRAPDRDIDFQNCFCNHCIRHTSKHSSTIKSPPMYASFYIPQEKYSTQMRVAEKMMFMGLPHFKDTQSRCKECNRKVDSPVQISVGYQLRNNALFMTVRPVPPKSKCKVRSPVPSRLKLRVIF
ncbi:hypothetical protein FVER53590_25643 [Fusarium verticillioides]|nr:hypothetical protein FVER53590_25643 [Fusarium verticillioides]